jgi:hypothetical protein
MTLEKRSPTGELPGRRNRRQVHHGVELALVLIHPAQHGFEHLAEIGKVDADGRADRVLRQRLVKIKHRIAVGDQILEHGLAKLAAATCHQNSGHRNLPDRVAATLAFRRAA